MKCFCWAPGRATDYEKIPLKKHSNTEIKVISTQIHSVHKVSYLLSDLKKSSNRQNSPFQSKQSQLKQTPASDKQMFSIFESKIHVFYITQSG